MASTGSSTKTQMHANAAALLTSALMVSTGTWTLAAAIALSKSALPTTTGMPAPALVNVCQTKLVMLVTTGTLASANAVAQIQATAHQASTGKSTHARANANSRLPHFLNTP